MSPKGISSKLAKYVFWAYLFHSDEKTHSPPWACIASLKPPIPANKSIKVNRGFSGLATIDEDKKQIQILAGGTDRDAVITLNNLDKTTAFSGVTSVTVTAEYVDYKGLSGIVNVPKTKFVKNLPVENGTLEISLENLLYTQCLRFTITPQDESVPITTLINFKFLHFTSAESPSAHPQTRY